MPGTNLDCDKGNAIIECIMREPWYYDVIAPVYDTIVPRDIKGICDSLEDIVKRYTKSNQIVDLTLGARHTLLHFPFTHNPMFNVEI